MSIRTAGIAKKKKKREREREKRKKEKFASPHGMVVIYFAPYNYWGHAVVYLVEALCYKPEGRGFDFQRVQSIFHFT
jgi:hypothetical protein